MANTKLISSMDDAKAFFANELKSVFEKQHLESQKGSLEYMVELLITHMESKSFFVENAEGKLEDNVLAKLYADYLQGGSEQKVHSLKRLGDICLLVTGLFPDSLNRKLVDLDYYFDMGGSAYFQLSSMQSLKAFSALYQELAHNFKPYSSALSELTERNGLQTHTDILRTYEKWVYTGNERLKEILSEHGIATPVKTDPKIKH